jgi:hypothetical protein
MKGAARTFISINILIDPFEAEALLPFVAEAARNLFRAPLPCEERFYSAPSLAGDPRRGFSAPARKCQQVSLNGAVSAASSLIAAQFPRNSRLMHADHGSDMRLRMERRF